MRVFMLGWEFPPFISGGLGTACYGLTKAMSALGTDVMFVLPRPVTTPFSTHIESPPVPQPSNDGRAVPAGIGPAFHMDEFEHVTFRPIDALMADPYLSPEEFEQRREVRVERSRASREALFEEPKQEEAALDGQASKTPDPAPVPATPKTASAVGPASQYGGDLFGEVQRYAILAAEIARGEEFDVVHAHDWMTFPAALGVAGVKGKPLVVHVHSTEIDRSGTGNIDTRIYDIERRGMHAAIKVIAVSHWTKDIIVRHYGIDSDKIEVVYNAVELAAGQFDAEKFAIKKGEKLVLFLGRITYQKGPEYFLAAARRVLEVMDDVKFIMAGSGDQIRKTIEMAASMGIGHKVLFTGFLRGGDVDKIFKMADLYVMPSVSEPFGIAPLEAMAADVPVLISKQSGVSEVIKHALKVDFWDVNEMANKIVAVLKRPPLSSTLKQHGSFEVRRMSWSDSARQCLDVYAGAIEGMNGTIAKALLTV